MTESNAHYELYEKRGCDSDQDEQDWLRAEQDEQVWLRIEQEMLTGQRLVCRKIAAPPPTARALRGSALGGWVIFCCYRSPRATPPPMPTVAADPQTLAGPAAGPPPMTHSYSYSHREPAGKCPSPLQVDTYSLAGK
jgi:hypothetical protein